MQARLITAGRAANCSKESGKKKQGEQQIAVRNVAKRAIKQENKKGKDERRMSGITVVDLYDLKETIASELFGDVTYPWEVLPKIHDFILELGCSLSEELFEKRGEDIWIAKSAKVAPTACLNGPLIVDEEAEIRHCAFIRGNAIVGKGAVVGNSTELKNVVLFNKVQVPHYNYVGDSVLGDKTLVVVRKSENIHIETGLKKMGAMLGDFVEVGCNSVLNPGTVIGREANVYPCSSVRGVVPARSIYKSKTEIAEKRWPK